MSLTNSDKYHTFAFRCVALIVDTIVLIPLTVFGSYLVNYFDKSSLTIFSVSSLLGLLSVFYYILMHALFGQTLGKMLMKVKVVDISQSPINLGQAAIRSLPQMIPVIIAIGFENPRGLSGNWSQWEAQLGESLNVLLTISILIWTVLNIIVAAASEKHRALHDYMAGTIVIRTNVRNIYYA
jgi:uncharacterized RDD family membrane protein YckC